MEDKDTTTMLEKLTDLTNKYNQATKDIDAIKAQNTKLNEDIKSKDDQIRRLQVVISDHVLNPPKDEVQEDTLSNYFAKNTVKSDNNKEVNIYGY